MCFAVVCAAITSVLACWLLPIGFVSSVRTLVLCVGVAAPLVRRPIRIGRARGVTTVFNALRPAVALYLVALVLEQLVHTCFGEKREAEMPSTLRALLQHSVSALLIVSGLLRARRPRSESDLPFLLSVVCVVTAALLPPPPTASAGPLCEPTTLLGAGERLLRALLFAVVHAVLVYAGAPSANATHELFICVARSDLVRSLRGRAGRRRARVRACVAGRPRPRCGYCWPRRGRCRSLRCRSSLRSLPAWATARSRRRTTATRASPTLCPSRHRSTARRRRWNAPRTWNRATLRAERTRMRSCARLPANGRRTEVVEPRAQTSAFSSKPSPRRSWTAQRWPRLSRGSPDARPW